MDSTFAFKNTLYRTLYIFVCFCILCASLMPLNIGENGPEPDILFCITAAWVLRRPDYVPVALIALVFFIADTFLMRPLGLWAAIVVVGTQFLRVQEEFARDFHFLVEWAIVAATIVAMAILYRLVQSFFLIDRETFGTFFYGIFITILAYPVVVAITKFGFGIHKITPREAEEMRVQA